MIWSAGGQRSGLADPVNIFITVALYGAGQRGKDAFKK